MPIWAGPRGDGGGRGALPVAVHTWCTLPFAVHVAIAPRVRAVRSFPSRGEDAAMSAADWRRRSRRWELASVARGAMVLAIAYPLLRALTA
jgi:hypothetical protein